MKESGRIIKDRIIKGYQETVEYRKSMIDLAKATFALDFEEWYQMGYWRDNYIPYSILDGDKVVANVSISPMQFVHRGKILNIIQLGTVMTIDAYRNQGLIRMLMEEIAADYKDQVDGYFLFANDSVLEFYPKFGFQNAREYEYSKSVQIDTELTVERVSITSKEALEKLEDAIKSSVVQSDLWLQNNLELTMFYLTSYMSDNVFTVKSQDAYVIAELEEGVLHLHQIFGTKEVDVDGIITAFGKEVQRVALGFTPLSIDGFEVKELVKEDCTFLVKGNCFDIMDLDKLRIPTLSHT